MKIAVVILNWNGKKLLEKFLPSIMAYSEDANIYVADNASTDDSIQFLKTNYQNITILRNSINGGYAQGYNEALKKIDTDIFCLLNSDVEVTPNWLSAIKIAFKDDVRTSIVQPKILDFKDKSSFEYAGAAGGYIDKYGYPYCRGRIFNTIEKDKGQYDTNEPIFWASGACLFIKKKVFGELNGFDESFFAHMEEIDLCWRAYNLGYTAKFIPNSIIYHVGGATLQNTNPKKTYLNFRNSLYTLVKNAYGNLFMLVLTRLILDGIACFKFLFELKFLHIYAILKAHISFYMVLPKLLKKRKLLPKRPNYFQNHSIVWQYYFKQKKQFHCL